MQALPQRKNRKGRIGFPPAALWWMMLGVAIGSYLGYERARTDAMVDSANARWQLLMGKQMALEELVNSRNEIMAEFGLVVKNELQRRGAK